MLNKLSSLTRYMLLIMLSIAVFSCNKSDRDEDVETLAARDYALAHHLFDDVFRQVHQYAMRDSLINDTGLIVSFDECISQVATSDTVAVFPMTMSLNYSKAGTTCDDGSTRFGTINALFSGKYLNKGTIAEITFDAFEKDNYTIEGTMYVVNAGLNINAKRRYSVSVIDGLITGSNTHIDFTGEFELTWNDGSSTIEETTDDVFLITGASYGINSRGSSFVNEITSRYVSQQSCPWFPVGRSTLNVQNLAERTLNFGDIDSCDNQFYSRRNNTYLRVAIPN